MRLPFPSPEDTPNPEQSRRAAEALVAIVDKALGALNKPFELQGADDDDKILAAIDRHAYEYFCLSDDEITLIDDAVDRIMPAVQPHKGTFPEIWKPADPSDRQAYATTLIRNLKDWFEDDSAIDVTLEARNQDLAILRLTLYESKGDGAYSEEENPAVGEALSRLSRQIHQPPADWRKRFRSLDVRLLQCIASIWPTIEAMHCRSRTMSQRASLSNPPDTRPAELLTVREKSIWPYSSIRMEKNTSPMSASG